MPKLTTAGSTGKIKKNLGVLRIGFHKSGSKSFRELIPIVKTPITPEAWLHRAFSLASCRGFCMDAARLGWIR